MAQSFYGCGQDVVASRQTYAKKILGRGRAHFLSYFSPDGVTIVRRAQESAAP
jgi:hypothetical protein